VVIGLLDFTDRAAEPTSQYFSDGDRVIAYLSSSALFAEAKSNSLFLRFLGTLQKCLIVRTDRVK
jgi:hypothetical protein